MLMQTTKTKGTISPLFSTTQNPFLRQFTKQSNQKLISDASANDTINEDTFELESNNEDNEEMEKDDGEEIIQKLSE